MMRASILAVATTVALLGLAYAAWDAATPTQAAEQAPAYASVDTTINTPPAQQQDATTNDDLLEVQMWTLFAAGGAAALGLVLFLVRMAMGWVKPPPPQEDAKH